MTFSVKFWGVRGSIACPGPETIRYGGNTPCIEVRCGERLLIFDGGTGIRPFGNELTQAGKPVEADIFFSHCHIDHVGGLPFFTPFYNPANRFRLWAGNLLPTYRLMDTMRALMARPLFPIGIEAFNAKIDYRDFRAGETLNPAPGIVLRTAALDHPDGATGFRLEFDGRVFAYITDNESRTEFTDTVLSLARGADLAVYDCTYTDDEIASKHGWGHSTWRDGVRLGAEAGVKTMCLFHHAPEHDDACLDKIAQEAQVLRAGTVVAAEGMLIKL